MAEIRLHADGLTRAYVQVTDTQPVPRLVIVCGDTGLEVTPGPRVVELADIGRLGAATGARVIARAAAQWAEQLTRLAEAGTATGDRSSR